MHPILLQDKPFGSTKPDKSQSAGNIRFITTSVAQATVTGLLDALSVLAQAGCVSHLPPGPASPPTIENSHAGNPLPPCGACKANLVARVSSYLLLINHSSQAEASAPSTQTIEATGQQRVLFATIQALASLCMGEPSTGKAGTASSAGKSTNGGVSTHPHLLHIIKVMCQMVEVSQSALGVRLRIIGEVVDTLPPSFVFLSSPLLLSTPPLPPALVILLAI